MIKSPYGLYNEDERRCPDEKKRLAICRHSFFDSHDDVVE
jgi:hypothetical protein